MDNNNVSEISNIGKRIQKLREKKGLSQAELAKELNVKQQTVNQWEKGERDLKTGYTIALAKYFNVTADYILCLEDCTTHEIESIGVATGLSEENIKLLHELKADKPNNDISTLLNKLKELYPNEEVFDKTENDIIGYKNNIDIINCFLTEIMANDFLCNINACRMLINSINDNLVYLKQLTSPKEIEYLAFLSDRLLADSTYQKCKESLLNMLDKYLDYDKEKMLLIENEQLKISGNIIKYHTMKQLKNMEAEDNGND